MVAVQFLALSLEESNIMLRTYFMCSGYILTIEFNSYAKVFAVVLITK